MHDLIKNNEIIKSHDFKAETPPRLSHNKGKWLPRSVIVEEYDPAVQKLVLVKTITETESIWTYEAAALTQQELDDIAARKAEKETAVQLRVDYEALKQNMKDKVPNIDELFLRIQFIEKILEI